MGKLFESLVTSIRSSKDAPIHDTLDTLKLELETHQYDEVLGYFVDKGIIRPSGDGSGHFEVVSSEGLFSLLFAWKWKHLGDFDVDAIRKIVDGGLTADVLSYLDNLDVFFCKIRNQLSSADFRIDFDKTGRRGVDVLLSMDNNFFKTVFTGQTSLLNFQNGKVDFNGENQKPEETIKNCLGFMLRGESKIFHCADHITEMLLLTDNEIHNRRLPFDSIFIDANMRFGSIQFFGLLLTAVCESGDHLSFAFGENEPDGFLVFAMGIDLNDLGMVYQFTTVLKDGLYKPDKNEKSLNFIATFACNFLDFLHDPSVQYMKASESSGSAHKHLRRLYENRKIDLDKTYFVRIENPLRRYVDQYIHLRTKRGYSHRFWVRGHFRTLHADRYGEHVGQRIWIAPFLKGVGILLEKHYDIEKREDGSDGR
jgi:hypothetical protein